MELNHRKFLEQYKIIAQKAKDRGFFHIIISSTLVKVVSFLSVLFLPRFLTKSDFGLLTYIDNIRNYTMLINGMGIANSTLRYCAKDEDDGVKKGYFITALIIGIVFDIGMILLSIVFFILIDFPFEGSKMLLVMMSFLPLLAFLFEDIQLFLRAIFENKKYSFLSFAYSSLMVILQIIFAILWGLHGIVVARYIAVFVCIIIGIFLIDNLSLIKKKMVLMHKRQIIDMIKFGIVMLAANATALIMQLNEIFIIGQVLQDEYALAEYKVASNILSISLFFGQSAIIFVFPYFVKNMNDKQWIWKKFKKLVIINATIMIPFHILLIVFSKLIISILFGTTYINVVPIMQVLLLASLVEATFRGLTGNILAGIGEEKYNLKVNIIFAIIHAVVDIWAIKTFGIAGAAIALIIVYYSSGILMIRHLKTICKEN